MKIATKPTQPEPTPWNVPKIAGRFPILASDELTVDELRLALNAAGLHLHATGDGWVIDRVHAFALVKKDGE